MSRPLLTACEHRTDPDGTQHPGCGAPILLVLCIPTVIRRGTARRHVPLDVVYDPACGIPASHALSIGGTTCRPLLDGEEPGPAEKPALTHFATCPYRTRSTTS